MLQPVSQANASPATVVASINYLSPSVARPYVYRGGPDSDELSRSTLDFDPHPVVIRDARPFAEGLGLEREGFRIVDSPTGFTNFFNREDVRQVYFREVEDLVRRTTGASRAIALSRYFVRSERGEAGSRRPVRRVHVDYNVESGSRAVDGSLAEMPEAHLDRRYAIIQVWRPICAVVERLPLALCEAGSIGSDDLVVTERRYDGLAIGTYSITYSPAHRWVWFPAMRCDEALLFKVYDSDPHNPARWVGHTAFDDPNTPPDARPRESIEVGVVAVFDRLRGCAPTGAS